MTSLHLEWGPTGAMIAPAPWMVVVDVLSFTTTLTVAIEREMTVYPFRWKDERAAAFAAERDAVLARGRSVREGVSLSPVSVRAAIGVERLVLPSPNGSAIAFGLAESGATVVGASLRNASAVAGWLCDREGAVTGVAAGERWPDDTLRPAVEARLGPNVEFVVHEIRVVRGWAYVLATPQRRGGRPIDGHDYFPQFDDMGGLDTTAILRFQNRRWTLVDHAIGATDVWYCDMGPPGLTPSCRGD